MDNMTAKVSCFARAYHYKNNSIHIFTDDIAEKLLGEDYHQIAKSMSDGIDFFCPGFERKYGFELIEHLDAEKMTDRYFKKYNEANSGYQMRSPNGIGYVYAVKKTEI